MAEPRRTAGQDASDLGGARILIVEARFYEDIADALLAGASRALTGAGAVFECMSVPGSLEVAPAIAIALDAAERAGNPYEGVVALGCVIRGETLHFEIVAQESARALLELSVATSRPDRKRDTDGRHRCAGLGPRPPRAGRQRRRCCTRGTLARPAQAPPRGGVISWLALPRPRKTPRPIGAAPLAWPPCKRSIRWTLPARRSMTSSPNSRAIGSAARSKARNTLPAEAAFFRDVVAGVVRQQRSLDPLIDEALARSWPLKRIDAILRAVLRAGAYELGHRSDVPARVVVSEYVDVANAFFDRNETGMVNAVLDQIARQSRVGEFQARS